MKCSYRFVQILFISCSAILFTTAAEARQTPPTISPIPDQVIQMNVASSPIPFTVGDAETPLNSLFVTAVAADTSMFPSLILGGSDDSRTITIVPGLNKIGTGTIIVTVSDGTDATSDTFSVRVNDPPVLDFNVPVTVIEGSTVAIPLAKLHALDSDGPASGITYTVGPDSGGTAATHGTLMLDGVPVLFQGTFTQADIDNNLLSYVHDGSEAAVDLFTFSVTDADGGAASDFGHTVFQFHVNVTPVNDPPSTNDAIYFVPLGTDLNGTLSASDPDSPTLWYSISVNGTLGSVTITDSTSGAFTYTATIPGTIGVDSFAFQVYDGAAFASNAGTVVINMENSTPTATTGSGSILEGSVFHGTLHGTDVDLPPQQLTYSIVANGYLGSAEILDSTAGTFTYTPGPAARGIDSIKFRVSDGYAFSSPASYVITVRPRLHAGDIVFASQGNAKIIVVDSATGVQVEYASGNYIQKPRDVAVRQNGGVVVLDNTSGIVVIDPVSGNQTLLAPQSSFTSAPLGAVSIAVEADDNILIADGTAGIRRINSSTGVITPVSSGNNLNLALGMTLAPNGDIIAGDASIFVGGQSKILRIDPLTGSQTILSSGGICVLPAGIALDATGNIFVGDAASFGGAPKDFLYKIDASTGVQTEIVPSETLHIPVGLDIDASGKLLVSNNQGNRILRVDTLTGSASVLATSGLMSQPFGITIVGSLPSFVASTSALSFNNVSVGSSKTDSVIVSNPGGASLYITSVAVDSAQFAITPTNVVIPPSGTTTFYVTYTPTSSDSISAVLTFVHNALHSPEIVLLTGTGIVDGVPTNTASIPKQFALYANYPNPFNPTTVLAFDIPKSSFVTIKIYSVLGAEVAVLVDHRQYGAGTYSEKFDAGRFSSGVYFYEMTGEPAGISSGTFRSVRKMILIK